MAQKRLSMRFSKQEYDYSIALGMNLLRKSNGGVIRSVIAMEIFEFCYDEGVKTIEDEFRKI